MSLPNRLHHTAYVVKDLEKTRHFYEDVLGLPLVATWCEADELFGAERIYCHCFFQIADGGALAFFQFASKEDAELFGPELKGSPFRHVALDCSQSTLAALEERVQKADLAPGTSYVLEHGYCRSLYVTDPDGMIVEFTYDAPKATAAEAVEFKKRTAHDELKRWLAGDHTSNDTYR